MLTGLTSITFRQLDADKIIALAAAAGLDGIEWGGDVHLPPGETGLAAEIAAKTAAAGLRVLSYGSYFRLCEGGDFPPVLESAACLGAPNIRVWAGNKHPAQADEAYRRTAARELGEICARAAERGITVSLEYHRGTLTETAEGALELLSRAGHPGARTYWQPNPDISHAENCRELSAVKDYLSNIHVFQWRGANVRYPLSEGRAEWAGYLAAAGEACGACILEFVKDDSPEQFAGDAAELLRWSR